MIHNHPELLRLLIEDHRVRLEHDATTWNRRAPKRRPAHKPPQP
jgi:hypothetical protein